MVSTPTIKGLSRIEAEWKRSDKRHYHVPCQHCGHGQPLKWAQVQWPEGRPTEAAYVCTVNRVGCKPSVAASGSPKLLKRA